MAEHTLPPTGAATNYVGWRAELLAQLALSRLVGVDVFRPQADGGVDYVVSAPNGVYVAVVVKAYSSAHRRMGDVAARPTIRWPLDRATLDRARASQSPVVLFLFDADTEHGRYLRLDTLPPASANDQRVTVSLPITNTIDARSLERLLSELRVGRVTPGDR